MAAAEKWRAFREWAIDKWLEFRAQSGFFQVKVALVLGYVFLIVLPTVALAPPAPPTHQVYIQRVPFGLSYRTLVEVKNLDLGDLDDVKLVVHGKGLDFDGRERNGTFSAIVKTLPEGERFAVEAGKLFDDKGRPAPPALQIARIELVDGDEILLVHVPPP